MDLEWGQPPLLNVAKRPLSVFKAADIASPPRQSGQFLVMARSHKEFSLRSRPLYSHDPCWASLEVEQLCRRMLHRDGRFGDGAVQ